MNNLQVTAKNLNKQLPGGLRWVKLKDIALINPSRPKDLARPDNVLTSFVPMDSVDEITGTIAKRITRPFQDIKKGYTYFAEGDVLFSKITPCMQNGKHAIAQGLLDGIGFGTTEFHVIRPGEEVIPEWIHYFVRQPAILQEATQHFTGSVGQQRLPKDFLSNFDIPLAPIIEQKRITSILTEQMAAVEHARNAVQERLGIVYRLKPSLLQRVFSGRKDWTYRKVGELCEKIDYGYTASADTSIEFPKFLRITDIQNGYVDWNLVPGCQIETDAEKANALQNGDIVFTRTGATTGKSYLIESPPRAVFASYLIRIRVDVSKVLPEFIYFFFQGDKYWEQINSQVRGGAQPNFNATMLKKLVIPIPSIQVQHEVIRKLQGEFHSVDLIESAAMIQLEAIGALPNSILKRAFAGDL